MSRQLNHPGSRYRGRPDSRHPNRQPFSNNQYPEELFFPNPPFTQHLHLQQHYLQQQQQQQRCPLQHQHERHSSSSLSNYFGQAPICRGSSSGWPSQGSASISSATYFQPKAGVARPRDDQTSPSSTRHPHVTHPSLTQPGTPSMGCERPPTAGGHGGDADTDSTIKNNTNASIGRGSRGKRLATAGEDLPRLGHFPQQGRGIGQSRVQSSRPEIHNPCTSSFSFPSREGGEPPRRASSGTSSLPRQDLTATHNLSIQQQPMQRLLQQHDRQQKTRDQKQSQQQQQQQQQGARKKSSSQNDTASSSWTSQRSRSPYDAELKAKTKHASRKVGKKKISEKDTEKEKETLRKEMIGHVLRKFPNMYQQPYVVPPVRIHEKVGKQLVELSSSNHDVRKQVDIKWDTLLGYKTEDTVLRWLAEIISSQTDPVFLLSNYEFRDYLYHLRPKVEGGSNTSANTEDGRNSKSSERKTGSSQDTDNESENATENRTDDEKRCATTASGQAGTPASRPSLAPCLFPTPDDLCKKRGEFDHLIIIPKYGFIVIETKTMLGKRSDQPELEAGENRKETQSDDFRKKIKHALQKQLQKAETVLRHLTSDLLDDPPVTKLLAVPNTSKAELRHLLEDRELLEECGNTLGARTVEEALSRCITSELICESQPREFQADFVGREATNKSLSPGQRWWRALVKDLARRSQGEMVCEMNVNADGSGETGGETKAAFSRKEFEEIVARFCGPYSNIPVRTVSECIHLTGVLYGRSILSTDQLNVLESNEPFLFMTGPPGSGKTLLLGLKAAKWAKQGDQVVVVCGQGVQYGSLVSWTLYDRVVDVMRSLKPKHRKKAKAAAETAAVAADGDDGCDVHGDGGGHNICIAGGGNCGIPSKHAKNKTNRKKECGAMLKGPDDRLSSLECAGGPDKISASSGIYHKKDNIGGSEQNEGAVEVQSTRDQNRSRDNMGPNDFTVDNVHRAFISADTDIEAFVSELLDKYWKGNLRIILDESPKKLNKSFVPDKLAQAQHTLNEIVEAYETMLTTFICRVEGLRSNDWKPKERPGFEPCEDHSQHHEEEAEDKTAGEGGTSKPESSLAEQKDVNQANEKTHGRQKSTERSHVEENEGEKSFTGNGRSDSHTKDAHDLQSKPCLEVKREVSQIEAETSASVSWSLKRFQPQDYFARMEDRMNKLGSRFEKLSATVPALNVEWSVTISAVIDTYKKVKDSSEQAAAWARRTPECCTVEDVVDLEKLDGLVLEVMGFMYSVHNALNVFRFHDFLSAVIDARNMRASLLSTRRDVTLPLAKGASQAGKASCEEKEVFSLTETAPDAATVSHRETLPQTEALSQTETMSRVNTVSSTETVSQTQNASLADILSPTENVSQAESMSPLPDLSVWLASVYPRYVPPGFTEAVLKKSLRCPPNLQKILKWTEDDIEMRLKYDYITHAYDVFPPLPSNGPPVTWFDHTPHSTSCHEVNNCPECGETLVNYLVHTLGLRTTAEIPAEKTRGYRDKKKQNEEPQLYFHDVMICGSPIHQSDCAFIQELRRRGISVLYENQAMTYPPPYEDSVLVIGGNTVQGLEARIIVYVTERKRITDAEKAAPAATSSSTLEEEQYSEEDRIQRDKLRRLGGWNRQYIWHAASRSLSHLIIFH